MTGGQGEFKTFRQACDNITLEILGKLCTKFGRGTCFGVFEVGGDGRRIGEHVSLEL